jgi:HK97 gp10 family phage protein
MSGGVTIKLEGIGNVERAFEELANEIGDKKATSKILVPAVREAMQPVLRQAQSLAPVDTGALFLSLIVEARRPTKKDRRSKYITQTDTVIASVTTASGKKLKQMSEGKGLIRSKKKLQSQYGSKVAESFMGIKSDARAIAQEFGTARMKNHKPYLIPAIESQSQTTVNKLSEILARRIEQFKAKMK